VCIAPTIDRHAMTRFAHVLHSQWIAAPVETARARFADVDHHIRRNVHPEKAAMSSVHAT